MIFEKFSDEHITSWQDALDVSERSCSPLGGPEYSATMNMSWGKTYIYQSNNLFIPLIQRKFKTLKIINSIEYQGVRFNSFQGIKNLDQNLLSDLSQLPTNCHMRLHIPEDFYLPLRQEFKKLNFIEESKYPYYIIPIPDQFDKWFLQPGLQRNTIRKAEKSGVTVSFGGIEMLEDFYKLFMCSFDRWKSKDRAKKPHSIERFRRMFEIPHSKAQIALASHEGVPVSAVIFAYYKNIAGAFNAGNDYRFSSLRAGNFIYSEIIRYLTTTGVRELNMGGTIGSDKLSRFKKNLGAKEYHSYIIIRHRFPRIKKIIS